MGTLKSDYNKRYDMIVALDGVHIWRHNPIVGERIIKNTIQQKGWRRGGISLSTSDVIYGRPLKWNQWTQFKLNWAKKLFLWVAESIYKSETHFGLNRSQDVNCNNKNNSNYNYNHHIIDNDSSHTPIIFYISLFQLVLPMLPWTLDSPKEFLSLKMNLRNFYVLSKRQQSN